MDHSAAAPTSDVLSLRLLFKQLSGVEMMGLSLVVAFSTSLILKIVGWNLSCSRHLHSISLHLALVVTLICQQTSASPPFRFSAL